MWIGYALYYPRLFNYFFNLYPLGKWAHSNNKIVISSSAGIFFLLLFAIQIW